MASLGHNRKMLGAECMADMLEAYGVTHVFHVPAVLRKTFAVMESRTKIKRLHVHSEATAAYMADGYARATGKPGICMAQVIGALNLAAGLRDAWLAHSPVIAFTGGREPKTKFRQVYQEVDDVPAFEPVTKWNATVDDVNRFPDMVRQAFRAATTGRPGPVHLQFRGNEGQVDGEEGEMEPLIEPEFARVPPFRPEPDQASVLAAVKVLQEAQRPVIVAGGGVRASGAQRELVALAEALQIPVATSLNGKDTIAGNHPLSVRRGRHLFARERQQGRQRGRSHLLHRHHDRRHDHAFLGGAEDRHAGDPDRHRSGGARPELSAAGAGQRRRQGDARERCWPLATSRAPASARPGSRRRRASARSGTPSTRRDLESDAVPIHPARICHELSASTCRMTPSSWSTPAMPACGWAACTICAPRSRATSAAPAISAGRFRRASAPNAARRTGRW